VAGWRKAPCMDIAAGEIAFPYEDPGRIIARSAEVDADGEKSAVSVAFFRRHRRPADATVAVAPIDPAGSPVLVRHPDPAVVYGVDPASIMVRGPTPRLVRLPIPPVVGGPNPTAFEIRLPAGTAVAGIPDASVGAILDPVTVRREVVIEEFDRHAIFRACS